MGDSGAALLNIGAGRRFAFDVGRRVERNRQSDIPQLGAE
jgi:hypothetical protein